MIAYCEDKGIPVQATREEAVFDGPQSPAHFLRGRHSGRPVARRLRARAQETCSSSASRPRTRRTKPEYVTLDFEQGNCVAVNGKKLNPLGVMQALNKLGGKHGVGRVDLVENRFVGMKSRGVYETPGGAILHFAHRQMESITMDREVMHLRDSLIPKYAELVYYGFWFAPERYALQALVTESQKNVTGTVRVKLYKGNIITAGRKSPVSLYNPHIATMEADPTKAYNQDDATGFIRLNGLRLKVASQVHGANKKR